jgi:Sulfotransferase domain
MFNSLVKRGEKWIRPLRAQFGFVRALENKLLRTTRIAVVSSPRSGNTWVRSVLARVLAVPEMVVIDWKELPVAIPHRCLVQIHWYREPHFQAFLRKNNFQLITLARHPLDVLLSVLHFTRFEPKTANWLEGNVEIPRGLAGSPPTSDLFKQYALSWGAENLLSVSYQWWHDPGSIRLRYEDLVLDPTTEYRRVLQNLHLAFGGLDSALEQITIKYFQDQPNRHGWQGRPGLWKLLIPADTAREIYDRHHRVFSVLGYPPPDSTTTSAEALANWERLKRK